MISVIIPVRDDPRVRDVVASLLEELPPDAEILVADDGPAGDLPALPGARIVPVHSGNPGNARNQARDAIGSSQLHTAKTCCAVFARSAGSATCSTHSAAAAGSA